MLIGAAGLEVMLVDVFGCEPPSRRTLDVDLAVCVPAWSDFGLLKSVLSELDGGTEVDQVPHRFKLASGQLIDLVPFGGVAEDGVVCFPPPSSNRLVVMGVEEALRDATTLLLPGRVIVKLPLPEDFVLLKFFAWEDRHYDKPDHDAIDLRELLTQADRFEEEAHLWETELATIERSDFDLTCANIDLLGQRLARRHGEAAVLRLAQILEVELDPEGRREFAREWGFESQAVRLVGALWRGLAAPLVD